MISLSHYSPSSSLISQQPSSLPVPNATPHPIQPTVLAMCQAVISTAPSSNDNNNNNEWFFKLTSQRQPVIVAPILQTQTFSNSSHRAIRVQFINKHDAITLPPPTSLPMTTSPPIALSPNTIDESTSTLLDYLTDVGNMFDIPNTRQVLAPVTDDATGYETLQNSSDIQLMDLDHHYDVNSWFDTPISNFYTNATDIITIL